MRSLGRHWANNIKRCPDVSHNRPCFLSVPQHACNNMNTPFQLFEARMTMLVAWCIP